MIRLPDWETTPPRYKYPLPFQPENSGGPLLDRSGSIVGVVVSKVNVERLAKLTGDMAQKVNFAIKPEVLRLFLDTNRVHYRSVAVGQRLERHIWQSVPDSLPCKCCAKNWVISRWVGGTNKSTAVSTNAKELRVRLFDKLISMFTKRPALEPPLASRIEAHWSRHIVLSTPPTPNPAVSTSYPPKLVPAISVTFLGLPTPMCHVTDTEVSDAVRAYDFVLTNTLPVLKTGDQWWNEATQKRRIREKSDKAYAWLLPFMPLEIVKLEQLQQPQQLGPHGAGQIAKKLRLLIRERRKAKEPHKDLLQALYGACVLADVATSLAFEGMQPHGMAKYVDIRVLPLIHRDLAAMRFKDVESLSTTDLKWLNEAFGEPVEVETFDALRSLVRQSAVSRYCWSEVATTQSAEPSQQRMQDWLRTLVRRNIGYQKEGMELAKARIEHLTKAHAVVDAAWAATTGPFVVADLETTGLSADVHDLLEFAAVAVEADGSVTAKFSMLVRVASPIPPVITRITGITQADVNLNGRALFEAMTLFLAFVGPRPVFFHNAPFDASFLAKAAAKTGLAFTNAVHDTLPLAKEAWPALGVYKLSTLAEHIGAATPTHRGLADAMATLAVLLAARGVASPAHLAQRRP